jgi:hypothetical protein
VTITNRNGPKELNLKEKLLGAQLGEIGNDARALNGMPLN